MGNMKEHFFELEDERRIEWIRGKLGNPDADNESRGWEALEAEYADMMLWLDEEAEYRWLERHPYNELYNDFDAEIAIATNLLKLGEVQQVDDYTLNKMVYSHAVTLLESFISTTVRALVVSTPEFMANVVAKIDELNGKQKYSLREIAQHPSGVRGVILGVLGNLTFHNPSTIRNVLHAMIGKRAEGLDLGPFSLICEKRHDIVHRNGRTIEDEFIPLDVGDVQQSLKQISQLARDIRSRIHSALDDLGENSL
jgi:hypothetical protein